MEKATQLHIKGIEPTDNRRLILSYFMSAHEPLSASALLLLLKGKRIHRATVFRILSLFEEKDILSRVDFHEGEYRFELSAIPHHHHTVCKTCGAVERVDWCMVKDAKTQIKKRTGFRIIDHSFTFWGVCKKCTELV
jgi:Fur family ferric uptake transcriptional regulator